MQFHVDSDFGDAVVGWVLPDNPGATPSISATTADGRAVKFKANVFRPDLKELGVHNTGMVGFRIDTSMLPNLKASDEIEIRDADTDVLIFRRFREDRHAPIKLMRFELTAMPQVSIESAFSRRFAATYHAVERYPFDTLFAVLNSSWTTSQYLSGRPHLTRYLQLLKDRNFKTAILLRDPIEELAERLFFLKFAVSKSRPEYIADHLTGLTPLLELAERLDFNDDNSLVSTLNGLSESEQQALSNPFVRTLACSADEVAQNIHVSTALENLANLDLVGIHEMFDRFKKDVATMIGVDVIGNERLSSISSVPEIARKLGRLRAVHRLLALDIKLYRFSTLR